MRAFLAVELPDDIKQKLGDFSNYLRHEFKRHNIVWVNPDIYHITLEFLGDIGLDDADVVSKVLEDEIRDKAGRKVCIRLVEAGAFPSKYRPRVLIVKGVNHSDLKLNDIQHNIHNKLLNKGFDLDNKKWHMHITLGRVKERAARFNFDKIKFTPLEFEVNTFHLMKSELKPQGPVYTSLYSATLRA